MNRGALIEYGLNLLGPIPNAVLFQYNPESLSRSLEVPLRPSGATSREVSQAGDVPVEKITFTAYFTAQEALTANNPITQVFGITPQLAALEKLVHPPGALGSLLTQALDTVGSALGLGGGNDATQSIPREAYPRVLFVWGLTRVLPVIVSSIEIVEQQYDSALNPTRAEVRLGLTVIKPDPCDTDPVAQGADLYSGIVRDAMALLNLSNTIPQVVDLFRF